LIHDDPYYSTGRANHRPLDYVLCFLNWGRKDVGQDISAFK